MNIEKEIRKLAKSAYWQEFYNASKDVSGIHLFENNTNLSGRQYLFLYWLRVYSMLYKELAELEWSNLDEEVILDDDRCDAFLFWRGKKLQQKIKEHRDLSKGPRKSGKNNFRVYKGPQKGAV